MNLQNKTVLVTGASSGLGLEIVRLLLTKGARVILTSRASDKLSQLKEEMSSEKCRVMSCDVANLDEIKELHKEVGEVDVLVNNAGIWLAGELAGYDYEQIQKVIEVNFTGLINMTREFLPGMKSKGQGMIVNVSSTSGLLGREQQTVYAATKWGVRGFTESLKLELKPDKIQVMGFYPGGMNTPLFNKSGDIKDTSNYMDPREVAEVLVFALSRPDSMTVSDITLNRTA